MANEPTIEQKNEAIALFMGFEKVRIGYFGCKDGDPEFDETDWQLANEMWMNKMGIDDIGAYAVNVKEDEWHNWDDVKYHTSWDWLMPVVDKIESLENSRFGFTIDPLHIIVTDYKGKEAEIIWVHKFPDNGDTKISMTHDAVYQFITWYNQQKQNNG